MLIAFSGLPGTGKTTIARELARQVGAVYLRIDSIEQAIRDSAIAPPSVEDAGYRAAYAAAADNLQLGRIVVADSVNPLRVTRDAWRDVAARAGVGVIEVEVVCSDAAAHRRRVESRTTDVAGLRPPAWAEVTSRDYEPWARERVVIDTSSAGVDDSVAALRAMIG